MEYRQHTALAVFTGLMTWSLFASAAVIPGSGSGSGFNHAPTLQWPELAAHTTSVAGSLQLVLTREAALVGDVPVRTGPISWLSWSFGFAFLLFVLKWNAGLHRRPAIVRKNFAKRSVLWVPKS